MTVPDAPGAAGQAEAGALEIRLGLVFKDRRLLLGALTHGSYRNEFGGVDLPDNERLEYLGDAVVDFLAAGLLFRRLPEAREGELTALRAALVCEASLARFARQLDLGASLRLGRGEAASGGRERSTLLCDAFESVIGALYLDSGLAAAAPVVEGLLSPALDLVLAERSSKDVKSSFQELAQRRWQQTPQYVTVEASGPDHARTFIVEARIADTVWGRGSGRSKAGAARAAAEEALARAAMIEAEGSA